MIHQAVKRCPKRGLHILCSEGWWNHCPSPYGQEFSFIVCLKNYHFSLSVTFVPTIKGLKNRTVFFVTIFSILFYIPPHFCLGKQPQIFQSFLLGRLCQISDYCPCSSQDLCLDLLLKCSAGKLDTAIVGGFNRTGQNELVTLKVCHAVQVSIIPNRVITFFLRQCEDSSSLVFALILQKPSPCFSTQLHLQQFLFSLFAQPITSAYNKIHFSNQLCNRFGLVLHSLSARKLQSMV